MLKIFKQDNHLCKVYNTRKEMGMAATEDVRNKIMELLSEKETINMIFAAALWQNEVLEALVEKTDIPWNRINAFHIYCL